MERRKEGDPSRRLTPANFGETQVRQAHHKGSPWKVFGQTNFSSALLGQLDLSAMTWLNCVVNLLIWGLTSASMSLTLAGDSSMDDPAEDDPPRWWCSFTSSLGLDCCWPSLVPSDDDDVVLCCVNRSCLRNLALRFWNQTCTKSAQMGPLVSVRKSPM